MTEQSQTEAAELNGADASGTPIADQIQDLELSKVPSPVLARLIDEVRNEEDVTARVYNRTHNRHNRSR